MTVKGNHPLAEIIARKMSGIESVPIKQMGGVVNRAAKAAVKYYDGEIKKLKDLLTEVINSSMDWQADAERMWTVDVQLSKQLIEDIKQVLSTEEVNDE
jgi:hypothetical protein